MACEFNVTIITVESTNASFKHASKIAALECPRCMPLSVSPEDTDNVEVWVEERKSVSCLERREKVSGDLPILVDTTRTNSIRLLQNNVLRALDAAIH